MAEDEGKKEEDKFEFTAEGELVEYISLEQARVLAMMRPASGAPVRAETHRLPEIRGELMW